MKKILRSMLVVMVLSLVLTAFTGCDFLNEILNRFNPACEHTGGEATCTDKAVCELCGEAYGEALGHTEAVDAAVPATCTEKGLTEGKHCSVCNEVLVAQQEVAALGHTEAIDAAVAPTCTASGKTEGKHCSVCNEVLVAQEEVDMIDHTWVDATSEAPKHCSVCGLNHIVIYFNNVNGWEEVAFWVWTKDGNVFSEWPGQLMTKAEGSDWYSVEFDVASIEDCGFIFSNNKTGESAAKTTDLTYDPAKTYWVGETAFASDADYQKAEAQKVIDAIGDFPATISSNADRIQVLQFDAAIAAKYAALGEVGKATVDANDTYKSFVALAQEVKDAGYSIAFDGKVSMISNVGAEVGNNGSKTDAIDPTYGNIVAIKFNIADMNGSFKPESASLVNFDKITFGIYNPLDVACSLVVYDSAWANIGSAVNIPAKSWHWVTIDKEKVEGFFVVINNTAASTVTWNITSILGYKADPNAPVDPETEAVLKDATNAGQIYLWNGAAGAEGGATVTVGTAEGHGNIFNIVYDADVKPSTICLDSSLNVTPYDKLRFDVYNGGTESVNVRVHDTSIWVDVDSKTVAAGEWSTLEFDVSAVDSKIVIYIDGVPGVEYKMGQIVGVIVNE